MVCGLFGCSTFAIRLESEISFVLGPMKTCNASPQAIELSPKCSWQAHSKRPITRPRNENMEYECVFKVLTAPSINRPPSDADA